MEPDLESARRADASLLPWLRRWHERGTTICGICTGVTLLAEAGLLEGRRATTHWAVADECRLLYPQVRWEPERFVTESGNIFCGGGLYAAIDVSLYLVEKYCGHEIAVQTAKALLLQTPRVWQSTYAAVPPRLAHDDDAIQRAQTWLFQNFQKTVRIGFASMPHGTSWKAGENRLETSVWPSDTATRHSFGACSSGAPGRLRATIARASGPNRPDAPTRIL